VKNDFEQKKQYELQELTHAHLQEIKEITRKKDSELENKTMDLEKVQDSLKRKINECSNLTDVLQSEKEI